MWFLDMLTALRPKQIMGYELSNNMEASSTVKALKMALKTMYDQLIMAKVDIGTGFSNLKS